MTLRNFKFQLVNGEDGTKMEKKNILNNSMKKGKMMVSLFIGMKMELRRGNGIIEMGKKMGRLKFGLQMGRSLKKQHIKEGKKTD